MKKILLAIALFTTTFLSANSSKARGVMDADIKGKPAEFALPNVIIRLLTESDKSLTY